MASKVAMKVFRHYNEVFIENVKSCEMLRWIWSTWGQIFTAFPYWSFSALSYWTFNSSSYWFFFI
ncbi:hypothetical protein T01_8902 [Trichinella spiralis]|uniref:Uncharacterized protein n=1 Tax=Trichinella spiralis TaxID=6334 RepID=A0A0V1AL67_TRISP|nr:hypothetical protein T01_8902 [Trichinella spiralis]